MPELYFMMVDFKFMSDFILINFYLSNLKKFIISKKKKIVSKSRLKFDFI